MSTMAIPEAMDLAVSASRAARGLSRPNPPVGAVILDADQSLVGVGHTQAAGGPHAEVVALREAGERARGGTAVVTLEPCAHTGRTGPCTQALLAAGVRNLVYAVADPNPVAAGGAADLAAAGVEVSVSGTEQVADGPLREWLFRTRTGRPYVTAKLATSLDGRVAAPDGSSQWITGPQAREHSHRVRAELDAIIVGTGTALADDPALTSRTPTGELTERQPGRVVVGRREIPATARLRGPGGRYVQVRSHDPAEALRACGDAANVQVEGGPQLLGAFLTAGLVDRVEAYLAPTLLGAGRSAIEAPAVTTLADRHDFALESVITLGADLLLTLCRG
nr:bifunctional diaminohydroxyphosphoribosylaminopyrimidine deaminase/5-amino-6-(5-phosphoribosylamino)uracil reductase RibD [Naumannella halotolerans]